MLPAVVVFGLQPLLFCSKYCCIQWMYTVIYSLYTTCFGFFETGVSDFQPVCVYAFLSCISAFSLVYHCILNVYMPHIRLFFSFSRLYFSFWNSIMMTTDSIKGGDWLQSNSRCKEEGKRVQNGLTTSSHATKISNLL